MSEQSAAPAVAGNELQQRYQQLLELAPLVACLAGLPASEGRLFVEEQIDGRAVTLRVASQAARTMVEELTGGDVQKYRQFRDLMPLTIALAGLPVSSGRLFGPDQVEARTITVKAAYRVVRATVREQLSGS
jgi:hypothetical protein